MHIHTNKILAFLVSKTSLTTLLAQLLPISRAELRKVVMKSILTLYCILTCF